MVVYDDSDHKLFVGYLPSDVTEDELKQVFGTYGEVTRVHVMDQKKKDGLMAAFVHYSEREAAEDAIKVLHDQYKIREDAAKAISVDWAFDLQTDKDYYKLFVGSIPEDVTEQEMMQVFSTYGEVVKVKFAAAARTSGEKGALVMYKDQEGAEDAIKVLDQIYKIRTDAKSPLTVRWANEKPSYSKSHDQYNAREDEYDRSYDDRWSYARAETRDTSRSDRGHNTHRDRYDKWDNSDASESSRGAASRELTPRGAPDADDDTKELYKLFVGNLPPDIQEDELFKVFSTYGDVRKVHLIGGDNAEGFRCAFVLYYDQESCEDAIKVLHELYKIRVDAKHPIIVRWANSSLNMQKGKGSGKGHDSYDHDSSHKSADRGRDKEDRWHSQPRGGWEDKSSREPRSWEDKSSRWSSDRWDSGRDRERDRERSRDQDRGWQPSLGPSSWNAGSSGWSDSSWPNNDRGWSSTSSSWRKDENRSHGRDADRSDHRRADYRDNRDDYHDSRNNHRDSRSNYRDDRNAYNADRRAGDREVGDNRHLEREGEGETGTKLWVGNLPPDIKEAAVEYVFSTYGKVLDIHIMMSKNNANGLASAFVTYREVEDADTAILSLNDKYEIRPGYGLLQVRRSNKPKHRYEPY